MRRWPVALSMLLVLSSIFLSRPALAHYCDDYYQTEEERGACWWRYWNDRQTDQDQAYAQQDADSDDESNDAGSTSESGTDYAPPTPDLEPRGTEVACGQLHTVNSNEVRLEQITSWYGLDLGTVARLNGMSVNARLTPGQDLCLVPPGTPVNSANPNHQTPQLPALSHEVGFTDEGLLYAGSPQAPVVVYEMFTASCHGCGDYHNHYLEEFVERFVQTGEVQLVYLPSASGHAFGYPDRTVHQKAYCVGEVHGASAQWEFWKDHYQGQRRWWREREPFTDELLAAANLNNGAFQSCLASGRADAQLQRARSAISRLPIRPTGTPYFSIQERSGQSIQSFGGRLTAERMQIVMDGR